MPKYMTYLNQLRILADLPRTKALGSITYFNFNLSRRLYFLHFIRFVEVGLVVISWDFWDFYQSFWCF